MFLSFLVFQNSVKSRISGGKAGRLKRAAWEPLERKRWEPLENKFVDSELCKMGTGLIFP